MKRPAKPRKPAKPKGPKEFYEGSYEHTLDQEIFEGPSESLQDRVSAVTGQALEVAKKNSFSHHSNYRLGHIGFNQEYEDWWPYVKICYTMKNANFEAEKKAYEERFANYELKLSLYEEQLRLWEKKMVPYNQWRGEQKKNELDKKREKIDKEIARLKEEYERISK